MSLIVDCGTEVKIAEGSSDKEKRAAITGAVARTGLRNVSHFDGRVFLHSTQGMILPLTLASYYSDIAAYVIYGNEHKYFVYSLEHGALNAFHEYPTKDIAELDYLLPSDVKIIAYGSIGDAIRRKCKTASNMEFEPDLPDLSRYAIRSTKVKVSKAGMLRAGFWIVAIAGVVCAYFLLGEEEKPKQTSFDLGELEQLHFQAFNSLNSSPNLFLSTQAFINVLDQVQHIRGWKLTECSADDLYVTCIYAPLEHAKVSHLRVIPESAVAIYGNEAHLTVPLEVGSGSFYATGYAVPTNQTVEYLLDRIRSEGFKSMINVLQIDRSLGLEKQNVKVTIDHQPLSVLAAFSEATKRLPVKLTKLRAVAQDDWLTFEVDAIVYSTTPFIPPVQVH